MFSSRVVNDWNSLPEWLIEARTVNEFKNGLKRHWKYITTKFSPNCYQRHHEHAQEYRHTPRQRENNQNAPIQA